MCPKTRASRLSSFLYEGAFRKKLEKWTRSKIRVTKYKRKMEQPSAFLLTDKKGRENSHLWLDINLEPDWTLIKSEHRILVLAYKFTRGLVFPGAKFPAKWLYVPRNSPYLLSANTLNVKNLVPYFWVWPHNSHHSLGLQHTILEHKGTVLNAY